ncbi:hypothetical protein OUZ56_024391 [Daphnia magna]|uniref:Uncharacterized protein n=1 Tax=Daphnia magna TaxID=35525 RepID=A0ABR0B0Q4_9CRUS|nr:hypothetical protein OUZ56_024391 [Daphnia magna]
MIDVTKKAAAALRQSAAMPGLPGYKNVKDDCCEQKSAARLTKMAVVSGLPNRPKTKIAGANKGNFPNVEDQNVSNHPNWDEEVYYLDELNGQREPQHHFQAPEAQSSLPALQHRAKAENRERKVIRNNRDGNSDQVIKFLLNPDFCSFVKQNFEYIKVNLRELTSAVKTLTLVVNQLYVTDKVEDITDILGFEFPLNEIETVKELENLLFTGDDLLLGRVGGDVVSSSTYRVMAKLMTNRLGTEITN